MTLQAPWVQLTVSEVIEERETGWWSFFAAL